MGPTPTVLAKKLISPEHPSRMICATFGPDMFQPTPTQSELYKLRSLHYSWKQCPRTAVELVKTVMVESRANEGCQFFSIWHQGVWTPCIRVEFWRIPKQWREWSAFQTMESFKLDLQYEQMVDNVVEFYNRQLSNESKLTELVNVHGVTFADLNSEKLLKKCVSEAEVPPGRCNRYINQLIDEDIKKKRAAPSPSK